MASRALLLAALGLLASAEPVKLNIARSQQPAAKMLARRQNAYGVTIDNMIAQSGVYQIETAVGTPPQPIKLQLDTGSSDVWVFSADGCQQTNPGEDCGGTFDTQASSTAQQAQGLENNVFNITYGDGSSVEGFYFTDNFHVGGATIENMVMGYAEKGISPVYFGICGVGFDANQAIVGNYPGTQPNPGILDNLVQTNAISAKAFSVYLNDINSQEGQIILGGYDPSRWVGDMYALPIVADPDTGVVDEYSIVLSAMGVTDASGSSAFSTNDLPATIVLDSGTPYSRLPGDLFDQVFNYFSATADPQGNIYVDCDINSNNGTLDFVLGGSSGPTISVPYNQFVLDAGDGVCTLGILPAMEGTLILGDTFLSSTYLIYDITNEAVGIAPTVFGAGDGQSQPFTNKGVFDIPNVKMVQDENIQVVEPTPAEEPQGEGNRPTEPALMGIPSGQPTQFANNLLPAEGDNGGSSSSSGGSGGSSSSGGSGGGSQGAASGLTAHDSIAAVVVSMAALGAAFFLA